MRVIPCCARFASSGADVRAWIASFDVEPGGEAHSRPFAAVAAALDDLESCLGGGGGEGTGQVREFLAGNSYSLADCAWGPVLGRLEVCGLAAMYWGDDGGPKRPELKKYVHAIRRRPSWAAASPGSFD